MKKLNYLLIGAFSLLFIAGCEKDELDVVNSVQNDGTAQRIVDFKSSVELKSTHDLAMEVDSMVWYVEAAMNMTYGHPHLSYVDRKLDSLWISVDFSDGCLISGIDVVNTYIAMHDFVAQRFSNYTGTNKHIVVVDVRKEGANSDGVGLWIYSTVGSAISDDNLKLTANPFQFYDWWWAADQQGRCNGYNDEYPGTGDAATQLELYYKTHNSGFYYLRKPGHYFTDIESGYAVPEAIPENFPNPDPAAQDEYPTLIFFGPEWNTTCCLSPEILYFLLDKMDDVLIGGLPTQFAGKKPLNIKIWAAGPVGTKDYCEVVHWYEYSVGKYHYNVGKPKYKDGKVFINDTQYFENVPQVAWEFYIGGYQPAQKWLKDRKDRKLEFDDILHYQKIIVALAETDRLMKEIDKIEIV